MSARPPVPASDPNSRPLPPLRRGAAAIGVAGCILVAFVLRLLASTSDPWLDEVWTFRLLPQMLSASDVIFHLPHANNHPLNTLFLYWIGDAGENFALYRAHSIFAGVATVVFAGLIGARRGRAEASFALLLTATSFLLIHYASQARGYSLMIGGAYGALYFAYRYLDSESWADAVGYAIATAVGLFANLYYLHAFIGIGVWTGLELLRRRGSLRAALPTLLRLHAVPIATAAYLYLVFYLPGLRGTQIRTSHYAAIMQTGSLLLGGPFGGLAAQRLFWTALAIVTAGAALVWRRPRSSSFEWLFWVVAVLASPAALLVVTQPKALFVRFFSVAIAYALLLGSFVLAALWRSGRIGAAIAAAAAAAMIYSNLQHVDLLIERGRGQYLAAIRYMATETLGPRIHVGSNHEYGTGVMLDWYQRFLPDKTLVYHPKEDPASPPEWIIQLGDQRPRNAQYAGQFYARDRLFGTSGFGFQWQLYRRVHPADIYRR